MRHEIRKHLDHVCNSDNWLYSVKKKDVISPEMTRKFKNPKILIQHCTLNRSGVILKPKLIFQWNNSLKYIVPTKRSEALTVWGRSITGIMGSNPIRGMDLCVRVFLCLYYPVYMYRPCVGPIPPSKKSYQLSNRFISFRKNKFWTGTGQEA
jgi:hypothetical protein